MGGSSMGRRKKRIDVDDMVLAIRGIKIRNLKPEVNYLHAIFITCCTWLFGFIQKSEILFGNQK